MPDSSPRRTQIRLDQRVYAQPGLIALLTACTHKKTPLFKGEEAAAVVADEIRRLHGDIWRILGYRVMPNHVHLFALNVGGSLLDLMKRLKGRTSTRLRGVVNFPVWQRSFHDHILRRNEDINRTIRYLLENPLRAGLVNRWTEYPWCGSMEWPGIDDQFFAVNPSHVIWSELFALTGSHDDPEGT